jgi:hypothetical protein
LTRFVVDSSAVLHLASADTEVPAKHNLLAPTLLRSQTLSTLPLKTTLGWPSRAGHHPRGMRLTETATAATVPLMSATVDSFFDEYARAYTEGDVEAVTSLCHWPLLAVRRGEAIHMPDRDAVWDHFASAIAAYRLAADAEKWTPLEIDTRQLGEHSVFATVHWNALDRDGQVVRDTWTSYQLLATPDGWRFLSYTNHF